MSEENQREQFAARTIVYHTPAMDDVVITGGVAYGTSESEDLIMDIYRPADAEGPLPAVVLVTGFPDPGYRARLGCRQKEMGSYISWARAIAACGLAAITYSNTNPVDDIHTLLDHLEAHGDSLGIDGKRIGLWSCSANVPNALAVLMGRRGLKCAVLCYGFMLDLDGSQLVAEAAGQWGFANPCAGRSVDDLADVPLFLARAGRDEIPHLNDVLDPFIVKALARNLALTLVNHREGPHAFDLDHDSETSRRIIKQILGFLEFHLLG